MNLILGLAWLAGAIGLFTYEYVTGTMPLGILGKQVSAAWFLLLLSLYNFARWYSARSSQADQQAQAYVAEARMRQAQRRHREEHVPDPTFDFTDNPGRPHPPLERPPSDN